MTISKPWLTLSIRPLAWPFSMKLKSCVGPPKGSQSVAAPPLNANGASPCCSVVVLPSTVKQTPSPCSTANQRCTPVKLENGPDCTTSATDTRHSQSSARGHASSSRVVPPPLRHGVGGTSLRQTTCQSLESVMPETALQSCSACRGTPAAPG